MQNHQHGPLKVASEVSGLLNLQQVTLLWLMLAGAGMEMDENWA